jgi:hypothetical protein
MYFFFLLFYDVADEAKLRDNPNLREKSLVPMVR